MKYEVGDKIRIKSLDWYNENKDKYGTIYTSNGFCFCDDMTKHCGDIMKIIDIIVDPKDSNQGYYIMDNVKKWTDEMIECKVGEETKPKFKVGDGVESEEEIEFTEEDKFWCDIMSESDPTTYVLPEGYQFVDENGNTINATKIVLEKKKKEYPKTYEECCKVMGVNHTNDLDICEHCDYKTEITYYEDSLLEKIEALYRLRICRDAYWKIYGEETGLGKPWEPDWNDGCYVIFTKGDGLIELDIQFGMNAILAFPTKKMRDDFYEAFKEEIEKCKEFL